uniref:30S ribosomal protein S15 n=1 Tax=Lotharella oceanica TaxID=641309 RepID=A0A7S2TSB0_9EUKA|mmetsp:Transcript_24814/g.46376  ORF Transcript_24814/g.46376 Transcript_24814/m.46376 type:complete len:257 (+) Transcript_24814:21-791(+)
MMDTLHGKTLWSRRHGIAVSLVAVGCVLVLTNSPLLGSGRIRAQHRVGPTAFAGCQRRQQTSRNLFRVRSDEIGSFNAQTGDVRDGAADDLFAEAKSDDDSLFAILREPLRPPTEWVPVDVSGADWLGSPNDDDLLDETPTESQEEILREYMRHEDDFGSPEYQIAKITQKVYHLTKHLATNRKDYSTRRGLVIAIQDRRKHLVDLYKRDPQKFKDVVTRLGIRARLPPKPTLRAMDKKAPRRIKTKTNRPMGQAF